MAKNYIICTTQRSGSSFICECLRMTGRLGAPTEWLVFLEFNDSALGGEELQLKTLPLLEIIQRRAQSQQMLSHCKLAGWKIMWSTMAYLDRKMRGEGGAPLDRQFLETAFERPVFIYLERANKIEQAISHATLARTGISHASTERELRDFEERKRSISLNFDEITFYLKKLLLDEDHWSKFFADNGIEPLCLEYEEFCGDVAGGLAKIGRYVGENIDPTTLASISQHVGLKKTRSHFERSAAKHYLAELLSKSGSKL